MHETIQPITTWSLAEKVQESNHSVLSVDKDNLIMDWIFPPPDPIPEGYCRDMGIYTFDTTLYSRLANYPHQHEKYIMGACIKMCGENDNLAAVVYSGEWIHFENLDDLRRTDWHL